MKKLIVVWVDPTNSCNCLAIADIDVQGYIVTKKGFLRHMTKKFKEKEVITSPKGYEFSTDGDNWSPITIEA